MDDSKKKQSVTLQQSFEEIMSSLRSLGAQIAPHLGFIYVIIMLLSITMVVYSVTQIMQLTNTPSSTPTTSSAGDYTITFDKKIILKIESLNSATAPNSTIPGGRINPFSEGVY